MLQSNNRLTDSVYDTHRLTNHKDFGNAKDSHIQGDRVLIWDERTDGTFYIIAFGTHSELGI